MVLKKDSKTFVYNGKIILVSLVLIFVAGLVVGNVPFGTFTGSYLKTYKISETTSFNYNTDPNAPRSRGDNLITEISVTPGKVAAGQAVKVTIDPGVDGVRVAEQGVRLVYFGDNNDKTCKTAVVKDRDIKNFVTRGGITTGQLSGFKLFIPTTKNYYTYRSFQEGYYAIAAYDYRLNEYVCSNKFIIYHGRSLAEDMTRYVSKFGGI